MIVRPSPHDAHLGRPVAAAIASSADAAEIQTGAEGERQRSSGEMAHSSSSPRDAEI